MLFQDRSRAESFGAVAAQYDRARPAYPSGLVDALLVDAPQTVLDVGCGTGIASALFAARGCAVLGVEVDPRMAELARAKGVEVEVTRFEDWQPRSRRFDLLTSAQAWHWIEPKAGAVRAAQALRAGGTIGLFWNFGRLPPQVRELLTSIYTRLEPAIQKRAEHFSDRDARVRATLAGMDGAAAFGQAEITKFTWSRRYDTAAWLEELATHSDHRALAPARCERLLAAVGDAIQAIGGSFELSYETMLIRAPRLYTDVHE